MGICSFLMGYSFLKRIFFDIIYLFMTNRGREHKHLTCMSNLNINCFISTVVKSYLYFILFQCCNVGCILILLPCTFYVIIWRHSYLQTPYCYLFCVTWQHDEIYNIWAFLSWHHLISSLHETNDSMTNHSAVLGRCLSGCLHESELNSLLFMINLNKI